MVLLIIEFDRDATRYGRGAPFCVSAQGSSILELKTASPKS